MNTMQQEFDAVVQHLFKQGRPSHNAKGLCAYRGKGKLMCAVGCRIPDNLYHPEMDEKETTLRALLDKGYELPEELSAYKAMFEDLQIIHDNEWYDDRPTFSDIEEALQQTAETFGLIYNPRRVK